METDLDALPEKVVQEQVLKESALDASDDANTDQEKKDDEEEEEQCGFCIFMRGGGCKQEFNAWSDCVDKEREEGKDFTAECRDQTVALQKCMLEHKDYYAPLLEAEEAGALAEDQEPAQARDAEAEGGITGGAGESQEAAPSADDRGAGDADAGEAEQPLDTPAEEAGAEADEPQEEEQQDAEEQQEAEDEEEEEEKPQIEVRSVRLDPRFPSTNQARACYTGYNEFHKCVAEHDGDETADDCSYYARVYRAICPSEWIERWNEQRENGTWPGRY